MTPVEPESAAPLIIRVTKQDDAGKWVEVRKKAVPDGDGSNYAPRYADAQQRG